MATCLQPFTGGGPVSRFNDIGIDGSMILKRLVDSGVLLQGWDGTGTCSYAASG